MKKRRKNNRAKRMFIPVTVVAAVMTFLIYADYSLRPVVITVAQYRIQSLINKAVNNAIISVIDETNIEYSQLVEIKKNSADEIVSVNYNSLYINKLRSQLVKAAMEHTQQTYIFQSATLQASTFCRTRAPSLNSPSRLHPMWKPMLKVFFRIPE